MCQTSTVVSLNSPRITVLLLIQTISSNHFKVGSNCIKYKYGEICKQKIKINSSLYFYWKL